jgi:diacylglycerol kinase family enzyme
MDVRCRVSFGMAAHGFAGVVLNSGSGQGAAVRAAETVRERLGRAGFRAEVTLAYGPALVRAARGYLDRDATLLVAGGGDGTIGSIAALAVDAGIPLGVLPLGTRNHFANDAGVPLELDAALEAIVAGHETAVDVGEVGGRIFLNNVSLGVYPRIVALRERYRERGLAKWLALLWASLTVLRRSPFVAVRLTVDETPVVRRTPLVLVSNNAYRLAGLQAAKRDTLTDGCLAVYDLRAGARGALLRLAWAVLLGRTGQSEELEAAQVRDLVIETRRGHVRAGVDGELVDLKTPLEFRTRPRALRLLVPNDGGGRT